ncbi:hypothetical protein L1887_26626 [Cichorium endivia]|nr:hypothetical protein L1887_26626 [Cichorium endivia]
MVIEVLALSVTFIIFFLHRLRQNLPPGPRPWPIVGNMYQLRPNDFRLLARWSNIYGPIASFRIGSSLCITVSNPKLAKEVLKDHDQLLANRHRTIGIARFSRNGDDLTWADYGLKFVKLKKLCVVEFFSPKNLEAHKFGRENEISVMIDSITKDSFGKVLVVKNCLKKTTFNIVATMIFGNSFVDSNGELDSEGWELIAIMEAQFRAKVSLGIVEEVGWLRWLSWLKDDENKQIQSRNHRFFQAAIHKKEKQNCTDHRNFNFLDALLSRCEEYNLSDDTISGLLWDMVTAGIDTTVIVVEWAMTELVINPTVQRKVQEELDKVIGLLPFGSGRRVCPGAQLAMNLVSLMVGRLLHHFEWSLPEGFRAEEIDMIEMLGIVAYKKVPLEVHKLQPGSHIGLPTATIGLPYPALEWPNLTAELQLKLRKRQNPSTPVLIFV